MTGCEHNRERTITYNFDNLVMELDCPHNGCPKVIYNLKGEGDRLIGSNGNGRTSPYLEHKFIIKDKSNI